MPLIGAVPASLRWDVVGRLEECLRRVPVARDRRWNYLWRRLALPKGCPPRGEQSVHWVFGRFALHWEL